MGGWMWCVQVDVQRFVYGPVYRKQCAQKRPKTPPFPKICVDTLDWSGPHDCVHSAFWKKVDALELNYV